MASSWLRQTRRPLDELFDKLEKKGCLDAHIRLSGQVGREAVFWEITEKGKLLTKDELLELLKD